MQELRDWGNRYETSWFRAAVTLVGVLLTNKRRLSMLTCHTWSHLASANDENKLLRAKLEEYLYTC